MSDTQEQSSGSPFPDARAIRDMAELRFDVPPDSGARPWSLIRITPEPHSGSATFADAMIEGETGRLVDVHTLQPIPPEQTKPRIIKEGSWQMIEELGKAAGVTSGEYSWLELPRERIRRLAPDDLYSPFVGGGIILCAFDVAAEGPAQFQSVYLVPQGWAPHVKAAWEQFQSEPAFLPGLLREEKTRRLAGLITGPNPIVATLAFRDFIRAGADEPNWSTATAQRDGREAEFTYLLLDLTDPAERWRELLENAGGESARAVAAGALAAAMFGNSGAAQAQARELLNALREKPGADADPFVGQVLKVLGMG